MATLGPEGSEPLCPGGFGGVSKRSQEVWTCRSGQCSAGSSDCMMSSACVHLCRPQPPGLRWGSCPSGPSQGWKWLFKCVMTS
jgi:hypothetical protein